jgi:hypothetical protein
MAYDFTTKSDGAVKATELVISIFDQVDSAFYDVLYPDILWKQNIPAGSIKTDISPGAMNHVYRSRDTKGMGQFVNGDVKNIPRVGQTIGQITVPILDAAVGCTVTDAEARRYQMGFQSSLAQDLGEVMRRATELHVERTFHFGDTFAGFLPYLDYSTVTKIPADAWTGDDPREWVEAINDAITAVWTNSKTVHMPDTIQMPPSLFSMLSQAYVIGTGSVGVAVSALKYLVENNICTMVTGKALKVEPLRYLEGAGVLGADRIIIKENLDRNFVMPFPLPYQLAQPVPVPLGVETFAEYIFGSFNVRYPGCMAYMDVAQADDSSV